MTQRAPTQNEVIRAAIAQAMLEVHTSMPGYVVSLDSTKRLATVQPSPMRKFRGQEPTALPPIPNCPIMFPHGDGFGVTWELVANDPVMLCIAERSIDLWIDSGGLYDPKDNRRHALIDAWAIPVGGPTSLTLPIEAGKIVFGMVDGSATLKITKATSEIEIEGSKVKIGASAAEPLVKGNTLQTKINAMVTVFNAHVHPGVTAGPGSTGTTATPQTALDGSQNSSKHVVE